MKIIPAKSQIGGWIILVIIATFSALLEYSYYLPIALSLVWVVLLFFTGKRFSNAEPLVTIDREAQSAVGVDAPFLMTLRIQSAHRSPLQLKLYDHYPAEFKTYDMPIQLDLPALGSGEIRYFLTPSQRGKFTFAGAQVRYPDKWFLWQKNAILPPKFTVRVFPVFYHKLPKTGFQSIALTHFGTVHPLYARTGNGDFDHLRAYRAGDPLNRLDHKASARLNEPVSREFIFEHEQPVMLLLDCSRRMHLTFNEKTLLDESLNAAFLLAKTALAQGDEFGMGAFSTEFKQLQKLGRGTKQFRRLQEHFFDLLPDENPPNFLACMEQFYRWNPRPSLIILLTTLQDGDRVVLEKSLRLLKRKHHVLLVSLRPPLLDAPVSIDEQKQASFIGARDDYANRFSAMQNALRREKIWFLECRPDQLKVQLINSYLKYKKMLRG